MTDEQRIDAKRYDPDDAEHQADPPESTAVQQPHDEKDRTIHCAVASGCNDACDEAIGQWAAEPQAAIINAHATAIAAMRLKRALRMG